MFEREKGVDVGEETIGKGVGEEIYLIRDRSLLISKGEPAKR